MPYLLLNVTENILAGCKSSNKDADKRQDRNQRMPGVEVHCVWVNVTACPVHLWMCRMARMLTQTWTAAVRLQGTDIRDEINELQRNVDGHACGNVARRFNTVRNSPLIGRPDAVPRWTWFKTAGLLSGHQGLHQEELNLGKILEITFRNNFLNTLCFSPLTYNILSSFHSSWPYLSLISTRNL